MTKLERLIQNYKEHAPDDFAFDKEVTQIIKNVYTSLCSLPNIEVIEESVETTSHQFKAVINLKNYEKIEFGAKAQAELVQLLSTYLGEEVRGLIDKLKTTVYIHNPLVISFEEHFIRFAITYDIPR